jgi:hypothetical protein
MDIPCKVEDIFKMYIILQHITKYIKDEWVAKSRVASTSWTGEASAHRV